MWHAGRHDWLRLLGQRPLHVRANRSQNWKYDIFVNEIVMISILITWNFTINLNFSNKLNYYHFAVKSAATRPTSVRRAKSVVQAITVMNRKGIATWIVKSISSVWLLILSPFACTRRWFSKYDIIVDKNCSIFNYSNFEMPS